MIQEQTMLSVADGSGAYRVVCIKALGGLRRRCAGVGDIIRITIKEAAPRGKVKKSDMLKVVVVHAKKGIHHPDGSVVRLDGNACTILNNNSEQPIGARIFKPITRELRNEKFIGIISLAPEAL